MPNYFSVIIFVLSIFFMKKSIEGWQYGDWMKRSTWNQGLLKYRPLEFADWVELKEPLEKFLRTYDYKIICENGAEMPYYEECNVDIATMARDYFRQALELNKQGGRYSSSTWRELGTGRLYGAMLILDPVNGQQSQVHQFKQVRDHCATEVLGYAASEKMRYLRVHIDTESDISAQDREKMRDEFVEDTMDLYFCYELTVGGPHDVSIYPHKEAIKYFEQFGFVASKCGTELEQSCGNSWFSNRCLMTTRIDHSKCPAAQHTSLLVHE